MGIKLSTGSGKTNPQSAFWLNLLELRAKISSNHPKWLELRHVRRARLVDLAAVYDFCLT